MVIRNCRATNEGSLLFELEDNSTLQEIYRRSSHDVFGEDIGVLTPEENNSFGVVKRINENFLKQIKF